MMLMPKLYRQRRLVLPVLVWLSKTIEKLRKTTEWATTSTV